MHCRGCYSGGVGDLKWNVSVKNMMDVWLIYNIGCAK